MICPLCKLPAIIYCNQEDIFRCPKCGLGITKIIDKVSGHSQLYYPTAYEYAKKIVFQPSSSASTEDRVFRLFVNFSPKGTVQVGPSLEYLTTR